MSSFKSLSSTMTLKRVCNVSYDIIHSLCYEIQIVLTQCEFEKNILITIVSGEN